MDWGSLPDWIVAVTATIGVGAGMYQLSAIRRSNNQSVQFERAKLLYEFDRDFESPTIKASRQKLLVVRSRFESEVAVPSRGMTSEQQIEEVARLISDHVSAIWQKSRTFDGDLTADKDESASEYELLMRLPYWCETLGHQCRRNLLPLADVLDLYDQLVINTVGNLLTHIKFRAEQGPHKNARYLENAIWLFYQAKSHKQRLSQPTLVEPRPAETVWHS